MRCIAPPHAYAKNEDFSIRAPKCLINRGFQGLRDLLFRKCRPKVDLPFYDTLHFLAAYS